jgi:RNA ligase (TIGR02306 family)
MERMTKFTHQAPVVVVKKEKHPDAEKLSIVRLCDNTVQVVVNTDSWQDGELAVWIQPQSVVDCWKEPFTFLNKNDGVQEVRVKAVKLRGYLSDGCLVKVPDGLTVKEGDDLSQVLGVKHWEPELHLSSGGNFTSGESLSKYDIDSGVKLHKYFEDNELVWVEEKIHGCVHEDTLVSTPDGDIKIKDIKSGQNIISYDIENDTYTKDVVLATKFERLEKSWLKLHFDNGKELICTVDHPILTKNRGYVSAGELTEKDDVVHL